MERHAAQQLCGVLRFKPPEKSRKTRQQRHNRCGAGHRGASSTHSNQVEPSRLSADLPRIEVIHELPKHELTCACGRRKHVISEETSEQLDIVPMQIRVIKHIRKVYGCRGCETAPVTADKPAQLIEKSMASPSVLAMLLTTKNERI